MFVAIPVSARALRSRLLFPGFPGNAIGLELLGRGRPRWPIKNPAAALFFPARPGQQRGGKLRRNGSATVNYFRVNRHFIIIAGTILFVTPLSVPSARILLE